MTDEFRVPSLADLERSHPDYPTKLEHGIMGIEESYGVELGRKNDLMDGASANLIARLLSIDGVTVVEVPELGMSFDTGCGSISATIHLVKSNGLEAQRKVEDTEIGYKRKLRADVEAIDDRIRALERASFDFKCATVDLTEVTPLNRVEGIPSGLHFYVVKGDKVYEGHVDLESKQVINPAENPRLKPEYFADGETRTRFASESSGLKVAAYLVRNPVSLVPYEVTFGKAVRDLTNEVVQRMAETDERKSPYERLADTIREAVEYFKGGSTRA